MKRIGFLSFGHWSDSPYSQVRSASDALLQSVELAVAAEELAKGGHSHLVPAAHVDAAQEDEVSGHRGAEDATPRVAGQHSNRGQTGKAAEPARTP